MQWALGFPSEQRISGLFLFCYVARALRRRRMKGVWRHEHIRIRTIAIAAGPIPGAIRTFNAGPAPGACI